MSGKIVRLNRSLYGLKQSGRQRVGLLVETVVKYAVHSLPVYKKGGVRGRRREHNDRVSAEWDPLQPARLPGRPQLWRKCLRCTRPGKTAPQVCD